jgi:PKHD-type hydroxylase
MAAGQPSDFPNFAYADNVLEGSEVGGLIAHCDATGAEGMIADGEIISTVRRSSVAWIPDSPEYRGLYGHIWNVAEAFNSRYYGFELTGFAGKMQVARYDAAREGGYDWHIDFGPGAQSRKLSLSIQLSNSDAYDGGNLEFDVGRTPKTARRECGLAIAFPSFVRHRVTPVTRGVRYSLVAWISGPRFR